MRPQPRRTLRARRLLAAAAGLLALALAAWAGLLAARAAALLRAGAALEAAADLSPAGWPGLCAAAADAGAAAGDLAAAAGPLPAAVPWLAGLPRYGPWLAAAGPLLEAAGPLHRAAAAVCAELPALSAPPPADQPAGAALVARLAAARPGLGAARAELGPAREALGRALQAGLPDEPAGRLARADALLAEAADALDLALAAPGLLGADGPRSYLLVVQNPDELRPTGGFISAAGPLRLDGGRVIELGTRDSAAVDDLSQPYPLAPEPLRRYMLDTPMAPALWLFRDANWSPNFPESARQMLALYRLGQGGDADGVLAITPEAVRLALAALGPVRVEGIGAPVDAGNVEAALRTAYGDALAQGRPEDRKSFVNRLAAALLARAEGATPAELLGLARAAQRALDQRDAQILLPAGDPAAALLAARGWDGAVRPGGHDFLMVVSANVGYNKVGPSVEQRIRYAVDLSDPARPRGELSVLHSNRSPGEPVCEPLEGRRADPSLGYAALTAGCYWNYLRVLVPGAAILADAEVPRVPDAWVLGGDGDGGRVYRERGPAETRSYGALVVVPPASAHSATFRYDLPPGVLAAEGGLLRYRLRVQRQAGLAQRAEVGVRLPAGAALLAASPAPASRDGERYSFTLDLRTDQTVDLRYRLP